jgi:hypothetical protein
VRAARIRTEFYHGVVGECQGWHGNCCFDIFPMAGRAALSSKLLGPGPPHAWAASPFPSLCLFQQFSFGSVLTSERGNATGSKHDQERLIRKGSSEILQMTAGMHSLIAATGCACEAHPDPSPY